MFGWYGNARLWVSQSDCVSHQYTLARSIHLSFSATQENELGELYLSNVDFLKNGVPASIIATLVVSTVGFLLMKVVG